MNIRGIYNTTAQCMDNKNMSKIFEDICKSAFNGDIVNLHFLLKHKIDLNQIGKKWTPLHSAIEGGNLECLNLLIEISGADIEYIGSDGEGTPLDHAVDISIQVNNNTGGREGDENVEIIKALLEFGADPKTAIQTAKGYGSKKIIQILESYC